MSFTSKQRSTLRSLAQEIDPIGQIGKGGISDNMISSFSDALEKRELIKISVLNNADEDAKGICEELAKKLHAEIVCTIGHKIVLYRYSHREGVNHVRF